jgi:hypothetical protein
MKEKAEACVFILGSRAPARPPQLEAANVATLSAGLGEYLLDRLPEA